METLAPGRTGEGQRKSIWQADCEQNVNQFPPLTRDIETDCCVIGAGIAGLTTAYYLAKDGHKRVVVLEDGVVAHGESGRTTAHLMSWLDDRFYALEQMHGRKGAALAAESHRRAIDMIEEICRTERIECNFMRLPGYLMCENSKQEKELEMEYDASNRCGTPSERLPRAPLPAYDSGPCLMFPRQGEFHPLRYYLGLVRVLEELGVRIYCHTHATDIEEAKDSCTVRTATGGSVMARDVVVATNVPINDRFHIHTKQAPYRTYAIAAPIARGSVPRALFWDLAEPYHYVRLAGIDDGTGGDYLIVGGEDHHTGQHMGLPEEQFQRLERWTRERFPIGPVAHTWYH